MNHDAIKSLVACLMGAIVSARIIHWNTRSYAEHKALGKFYSGLEELTDSYVEAYMGVYGRFGSFDMTAHEDMTGVELVSDVADCIQSLRPELPNDTQLQNIVDEIAALTDKTAYLLTLE